MENGKEKKAAAFIFARYRTSFWSGRYDYYVMIIIDFHGEFLVVSKIIKVLPVTTTSLHLTHYGYRLAHDMK